MNDSPAINRRTALAAVGFAGLGAASLATQAAAADPNDNPHAPLGWNPSTGQYELPPLPYAYDALEPHIDEQTMRIHHDKHHAGYVRGLNKALKELAEARDANDSALIKHWSRELAFHGSGHVNHALFWNCMAPTDQGGGGDPAGALARAITRDFGSIDRFKWQFKAASKSVEGSGWGWLVYEPIAGTLMITQREKHQNFDINGAIPLLGIDVWEHAYYLKYQNRRADYIDGFMNVINWPYVGRVYEHVVGG